MRSICPFCGNSAQTGDEPCCDEWQQTTSSEVDVAPDQRPAAATALPSAAGIQRRLSAASQPLVALLASSIIALCVSLGNQRRLVEDATWRDPLVAGTRILHPHPEAAAPGLLGTVAATLGSVVPPSAVAPVAALPAPVSEHPAENVAPAAEPPPPAAVSPAQSAPEAPAAPAAAVPIQAVAPAPPPAARPVLATPAKNGPDRVAASMVTPGGRVASSRGPHTQAKSPPLEVANAHDPNPPAADESPPRPIIAEALPADSDIARRAEREAAEMAKAESPLAAVLPAPPSPWHQLRRGMTQEEVLALLGRPRWKRHLVTTEWWLYKENSLYGSGLVGFSAEEGLMTWREP